LSGRNIVRVCEKKSPECLEVVATFSLECEDTVLGSFYAPDRFVIVAREGKFWGGRAPSGQIVWSEAFDYGGASIGQCHALLSNDGRQLLVAHIVMEPKFGAALSVYETDSGKLVRKTMLPQIPEFEQMRLNERGELLLYFSRPATKVQQTEASHGFMIWNQAAGKLETWEMEYPPRSLGLSARLKVQKSNLWINGEATLAALPVVAQPANLHTPADPRFEYSLVIWDLEKFAAYRYMSGLYASSDVCALAHAMLRLGALAEKHLPPILCMLIRTDWQHDVFERERLLPILMRRYEASSSAGLALRLALSMADCADSKDEFLELYKANTDDFRTWANR